MHWSSKVGRRVYLAGSIEHSKDYGVGWRNALQTALTKEYPHINVFDPTTNEFIGNFSSKSELFANKVTFDDWSNPIPNPEAVRVARRFIADDLVAVKASDLVVFYHCGVPTPGSASEITVAYSEGIPVITILDGVSMQDVELWIMGCTRYFVRGGMNEMLENLHLINEASRSLNWGLYQRVR